LNSAIFLEDFADIARPIEAARGYFVGDGQWLAPLASAAEEYGETLQLRVGPGWAPARVAREVLVTLGSPHDRGDALVVPIAWEPSELPALFPSLEGDIALAPRGPDRCRLTLSASYVPPLGELGRRLDRVLLHRVARSTVRSFLTRVVRSLEGESSGNDVE